MSLTTLIAGTVGAILASVLWLVATLGVPLLWGYLSSTWNEVGVGAVGASVTSGSVLIAAIVGFALGALWNAR